MGGSALADRREVSGVRGAVLPQDIGVGGGIPVAGSQLTKAERKAQEEEELTRQIAATDALNKLRLDRERTRALAAFSFPRGAGGPSGINFLQSPFMFRGR